MALVLGLDLGVSSIGWSLIDNDQGCVIGLGSHVFPAGVSDLGQGEKEVSKNAGRTSARGARRQFFRRRLRKRLLLRELAKESLCPLDFEDVKVWTDKSVFDSPLYVDWVRLNPYQLRAKALTEKISLIELGRIFYHFIQRRGFQSNSRSAGAENNEKSVIFRGDIKSGKIGISDTKERVEEYQTLGTYLSTIYQGDNQPYEEGKKRIRNRYTTRQMYVDEFELIWSVQEKHHQELTAELKQLLGGRKKDGYAEDGILFYQRPLRSQKHLVGNCTFEPKKPKCLLSAIPFEEFRVYQWVNTVECNGERLSAIDREVIIKELLSKEKVKFLALRKKLDKADNAYQFNYKDDDAIVGTYTVSKLASTKFFGKKWFRFSEKAQEDIWHILYNFDDIDKLKQYAKNKWGFDEAKATVIAKFSLKDGYANLSKKAILNILPFLKMGIQYDRAVVLGGIKNAFASEWGTLNDQTAFVDSIDDIIAQSEKGGFMKRLKAFLEQEYGFSKKQLDKLYHHSVGKRTQVLDSLPIGAEADKEIQSLRNPIVSTALFELRKVVNDIIEQYAKPDEIKIELARDLKVSKTKRAELRKTQKNLETQNDRIKGELDYINQRSTHDNILKYKLWEECNRTCPYTGKRIGVNQLFSGEVQIEHIQPWSKSLNDSFMNKTLCFADENRAKGDKTPYEFYSTQGNEVWEEKKQLALNCFKNKTNYPMAYRKFKHFVRKEMDDDFVSRQLNDTRYISKEAKRYLAKVCTTINVSPGQVTANIRQKWGLNTILSEDSSKNRNDHRHHAIDALVVACTKVSDVQELSKWNRYNRRAELREFPMPWKTFRADAEQMIANVLVSHKKTNSVLTVRTNKVKKNGIEYENTGVAARGQLHKESVFGKRTDDSGKSAYHIRKPVESLKDQKQLEKIVDDKIKGLIYKRIEILGGFVKKDKIPDKTFFDKDETGVLQPQIFLPNKNGDPVPVRKVRIKENLSGAESLKGKNQWVNPSNNHHVLLYKDHNGKLKENVVTFWTAVERKRQGLEVIQLPEDGEEIIETLQKNDLFLLGIEEEQINWDNPDYSLLNKQLYRVQKITSGTYTFTHHLVASLGLDAKGKSISVDTYKFNNEKEAIKKVQRMGASSFKGIKVKISVIGRIIKI